MAEGRPDLKMPYTGNLSFLNDIRTDFDDENPEASWLGSPFYFNKWDIIHPGHEKLSFDWQRLMPTGHYLTSNGVTSNSEWSNVIVSDVVSSDINYIYDNDYRHTLNKLKKIVFYYRHRRISRRCSFQDHFQFFLWIMTITEWVFLNADRFNPNIYLFELIDTIDIESELLTLWTIGGKTALFNLESRFTFALKEVLKDLKQNTSLLNKLNNIIESRPYISHIDPDLSTWLIFTENETVLLRAWMIYSGYIYTKRGNFTGILNVNSLFKDIIFQEIKIDTASARLQMLLRPFSIVEKSSYLDFSPANVKEYFPSGQQRLIEIAQTDKYENNQCFVDSSKMYIQKLAKLSKFVPNGLPSINVLSEVNFPFLIS